MFELACSLNVTFKKITECDERVEAKAHLSKFSKERLLPERNMLFLYNFIQFSGKTQSLFLEGKRKII